MSDIYTLSLRNSLRKEGCENRCQWRIRGCISHIISLQLYLRCSKCRHKVDHVDTNISLHGNSGSSNVAMTNFQRNKIISAKTGQNNIFCVRCVANDNQLVPVWQMSCFVDDGTAEFKVLLEDELIFSVMKNGSKNNALAAVHIAELRKQLESSVYKTGTMKVYSGNHLGRSAPDNNSLFCLSDSDEEKEFKEQIAISRHRVISRSQITRDSILHVPSIDKTNEEVRSKETQLLKLVGYIEKQNVLEIAVKVIPNDRNAGLVVKKKIKVQKISSSWLMENIEHASSFKQKMVVEALSAKILEESEIHHLSWLLLKELEHR